MQVLMRSWKVTAASHWSMTRLQLHMQVLIEIMKGDCETHWGMPWHAYTYRQAGDSEKCYVCTCRCWWNREGDCDSSLGHDTLTQTGVDEIVKVIAASYWSMTRPHIQVLMRSWRWLRQLTGAWHVRTCRRWWEHAGDSDKCYVCTCRCWWNREGDCGNSLGDDTSAHAGVDQIVKVIAASPWSMTRPHI